MTNKNYSKNNFIDRTRYESARFLYCVFVTAIGVLTLAVGYGAYMYKNKGKMSTSVYLMHLRVGAQGAAVGALTCGLAYTMIKQHLFKDE